jgi:hypothetical protein
MMQFSDRHCKALNTITFVKIARKRNGNSVKKTDATISSPCQKSGQQGFNADFGEHGLRVARSWTYCLAKRTAVDSVHLQAIHGPAAPAIFDQPICRLISTPCATRNP